SRKAVNDSLLLNALPERIKAEWRTSAIWSKSQLLQVLRAGSPEKLEATWKALKAGESRTVRDLRNRTKHSGGRPKHYRFAHRPKGKPYQVTVTFTQRSASRTEVRAALKDALNNLP